MHCVDVCPVKDTLYFGCRERKKYFHNRGAMPDYDETRWKKKPNVEHSADQQDPQIKK